MHEEGQARWDPENDPEYSQRLLPYLARRYYTWLLWGALAGAVAFAVFSLFQPPEFSTSGSLQINKGGGQGGLLSAVPQLLLGQGSGSITDEIQIMESRDIGLPIIAADSLQVDIYDPGGPDGVVGRFRKLFAPGSVAKQREDRYTRFTVSDVKVSDELLKDKKFWISADAQGNWHALGRSGANGQPADFGEFSFTPQFGPAHRGGDYYHVIVKTNGDAWKEYRSRLGVRPATDDSSVVDVSFSHSSPFTAKRVVEQLIDGYLKRNEETTYGGFDVTLKFIADETARSDKELLAATDELRDYQEKNQVYAPDAQGQAAAKEIADLSAEQTENQIQLQQAQFVLHLLQTRTPEEVYSAIKTPGVADALEGESDQLASLIQELHVQRQTKTEAHPDIKALRAQIQTAVAQLTRSTQARIQKLQLGDSQLGGKITDLVGQLAKLPAAAGKLALLNGRIEGEIEVQKLLKQQEAQTKLSRAGTSTQVQLLDTPPLPFDRDSPRLGRSFALGALAGAFVMILAALAADSGRRGFRSLRELRLGAGLPVLGVLPGRVATGKWRPGNGAAPGAERLGEWLLGGRRSLGIVHLGGAQASYDLAWSLACLRAKAEQPALLLDMDRLGGNLRGVWQLSATPGLAELGTGAASFAQATHKVRDGVLLLPPGGRPLNAEECARAWLALGEHSGCVLCCLPPPAQWQDQAGLLPLLDAVVLAVPQSGAPGAAVSLTAARLRGLGVQPLGLVVTNYSRVRDVLGASELGLLTVEPEGAA
jgi:uncharacterized protein involved in exopolysaccharide biosynthesis